MLAVLRRLLTLLALLGGLLSAFAFPAFADPGATVGPQSLISDTLLVSYLTTALISLVIPALVDLVTKATAPTWLKNLVLLVLSTLAAVIPTVTFVHGESAVDFVSAILVAFVTAMTAHRTGYSQPVQDATANFGITAGASSTYTLPDSGGPDDTDADLGDSGGTLPPERPTGAPTNDLTSGGTV